jgi:hypothetical protein
LRLSELPKNKQTKKVVETLIYEDVDEFNTTVKPSTPGGIGFRN